MSSCWASQDNTCKIWKMTSLAEQVIHSLSEDHNPMNPYECSLGGKTPLVKRITLYILKILKNNESSLSKLYTHWMIESPKTHTSTYWVACSLSEDHRNLENPSFIEQVIHSLSDYYTFEVFSFIILTRWAKL